MAHTRCTQIPTKHLDLTRQKLELTRLPREGSAPVPGAWQPKPLIESLIDYWYIYIHFPLGLIS